MRKIEFSSRMRLLWMVLVVAAIAGCAPTPLQKADTQIARKEWLKAVMTYRAALESDPGDVEIRSKLQQVELKAAEFHYQKGLKALKGEDYDRAMAEFEQGLIAMPENEKLKDSLRTAIRRREAEQFYMEAVRNTQIGGYEEAKNLLAKALVAEPADLRFLALRKELEKKMHKTPVREFALKSTAPITLNFRNADLRKAFQFLSDSFGINVIFDSDLKDQDVTLFAKHVSFRQALDLMLTTTRTFYKKVGENTLVIAPDTKDKRGQYADYMIKTFHLTNGNAKEIADVLKGLVSIQKVVVNSTLNTITLRDRKDVLDLASEIIRANDRKPAELILEVEILEVNKTAAEQLGFDYGSTMDLTYPAYPVAGRFTDTLAQGTVTLPTIAFRYFKQDVDAKTLANPKIRVVNGKEAKIHIGDRVPLRSSTIEEATGQTRTTFEYTDIGIRLDVIPHINLDNSAMVQLGLEVSSLGQNLGTQADPAYSIGTRNAQTYMLLRDGETAILGGLIRDEERRSRVKVPGLGEIPIIGSLFTASDDSTLRTDVLLTITPHVIRPWHITAGDARAMFSGTAENYSTQPLLADNSNEASTRQGAEGGEYLKIPKPLVSFENPSYEVNAGDTLSVELRGSGAKSKQPVEVRISYAADLLSFVRLEGAESAKEIEPGLIQAKLEANQFNERRDVGQLVLQAKKSGYSYLIAKSFVSDGNKSGAKLVHTYGANVVIK